MIKAVLFDLDATLLPMDQDLFLKTYLGSLAKKLSSYGYEPVKLVKAIWQGSYEMIKNDGSKTNEQVFWDYFAGVFGENVRSDEPYFDEFYRTDFKSVKSVCGYNPASKEIIRLLRKNGVRCVLATNPVFPAVATLERIDWAGLTPTSFELITTYENISYCKPNLKYYLNIAERLGLQPEECLMVGNDVSDDMIAAETGMQVFLLTDCLINKDNIDISRYNRGGFDSLLDYIQNNVL